MGKVHRIKRAFEHLVSQKPMPVGSHRLAGVVSLTIGQRQDGSQYMLYYGYHREYAPLMTKLLAEHQGKEQGT